MLRKPDPPVLVAVSKEANSRLKNTTVQILDYNLNRYVLFYRYLLERNEDLSPSTILQV